MTLEKEFVPYPEALELKHLGFDEPCFGVFDTQENNILVIQYFPKYTLMIATHLLPAPTFSQTYKWFREKHKLVHQITSMKHKGGVSFDYDIYSLVLPTDDELGDEDDVATDKSMETYDSLIKKDFRHNESGSYEEAELACLDKLIEIIKEKL